MARTRVTLIHSEVEAMLKSAGVRAVLVGPADRVAEAAKASAPVASGAYRDSIHRESATTDRAVELVVADAPHARIVESHTGNLARALNLGGAPDARDLVDYTRRDGMTIRITRAQAANYGRNRGA